MNKLILKEKKQSKEEKKQKKKQKPETIKITKFIIKQRLLKHFQNHIGEEEKTTQEEIFQVVLGINSYMLDSFSRFYFWKSIEKIIRKLRRENICFIIKKKGNYFVLKNQNEADYFRRVCDKAIKGMEKAETRADDWVEQEKWKSFKSKKYDEDEEEEKPNPKSPEETISEKLEKAKTKVIKLWKGETENEKI